jgi:hypothetical protein
MGKACRSSGKRRTAAKGSGNEAVEKRQLNMKTPSISNRFLRVVGDEITWAGNSPWGDEICFGTDSGGLLVPVPGTNYQEAVWLVQELDDTVNGVAFAERFAVVSTPSRLAIVDTHATRKDQSLVTILPGGAHDVISLDANRFLAPAGPNGLLLIDVSPDRRVEFNVLSSTQGRLSFYRAALLASRNSELLVGCAGRDDGILAINLHDRATEQTMLLNHTFRNLDAVDVIGSGRDDMPCGAIGLGSDGELLITKDLLQERPRIVQLPDMPGRAYTLRSLRNHLVLLTSSSLNILRDFFVRLPELVRGSCDNLDGVTFDVQASEIYVVQDRFVLIEVDDGVRILDIEGVFDALSSEGDRCDNAPFQMGWRPETISQRRRGTERSIFREGEVSNRVAHTSTAFATPHVQSFRLPEKPSHDGSGIVLPNLLPTPMLSDVFTPQSLT